MYLHRSCLAVFWAEASFHLSAGKLSYSHHCFTSITKLSHVIKRLVMNGWDKMDLLPTDLIHSFLYIGGILVLLPIAFHIMVLQKTWQALLQFLLLTFCCNSKNNNNAATYLTITLYKCIIIQNIELIYIHRQEKRNRCMGPNLSLQHHRHLLVICWRTLALKFTWSQIKDVDIHITISSH